MLAALFATLLAQAEPVASPLPAATVPAAATPPPSATIPPQAPLPGRRVIDDPYRRVPVEVPPAARGDALVRNSGSTNFAGYSFVVHPDATVDVVDGAGTTRKTIGTAQAKWLFANLKKDGPLDELGAARCMKSASFGSTTTIAYDGHASPDLTCGGGPEARELLRTVGVIVQQLGIDVRRNRLGRPML